jgi:hypothetical protein
MGSLYHLKLYIYDPRHYFGGFGVQGFNVLVYSMHIRVQYVDYESVEECAGTLAPLKFVMPHAPPPPPWPHMTIQDIDHQKLCLGSTNGKWHPIEEQIGQ